MVDRFKVVYPGRGRQYFDGGLNTKYERSIILPNESPDCQNVTFENGSVGTRLGSTKLNTTAVGSFVGDGIYTRVDTSGSQTMVVFAGGSGWQLTGNSTFTTISSAQSVFTAGVRVAAAQYENHLFCGNGTKAYKYNGTDWTRHGIPAATGAVSTASQATGVLTGDFQYKVTYVNSQSAEGNVGTATVTITAASATIRLSNIPTAPQSYGVSARRIYRLDGGTYKRVTEIANNTTTTYDDNIATSALGTAAPTDNGEPPNYNAIIYHQNRLFVNDPTNQNYVAYSELAEPYTFQSDSFLRVGDASTDLVKGFGVYDDALLIFCENSIWLNYMPDTTDSNWRQVKIRSPYGSKSPFGIVSFDNRVLFPAMQNQKLVGFAGAVGDALSPSNTLLTVSNMGSDLLSDRIETDIFDIQGAYAGNISAIVFKNKVYLAVTYGANQTTNNRIYTYDFSISRLNKQQKAAWVPYTGLNPAQFTIYNGKLYYITSTATGFVYEMEVASTYSDDGSAIDSYFWTKEFSGLDNHTEWDKDFRTVEVLVDQAGSYYMDLAYRVDSDSGAGTNYPLDLNPGSSIWNSFAWGNTTWGGGRDQDEKQLFLANARGRRIQFKFSNQNTVNQRFKVHGLTFSYNLKGKR